MDENVLKSPSLDGFFKKDVAETPISGGSSTPPPVYDPERRDGNSNYPHKTPKRINYLMIFIGIFISTLFLLYLFFPKAPNSKVSSSPTASIMPTATPSSSVTPLPTPAPVPVGWKIYEDKKYDFSFAYPIDTYKLTNKMYGQFTQTDLVPLKEGKKIIIRGRLSTKDEVYFGLKPISEVMMGSKTANYYEYQNGVSISSGRTKPLVAVIYSDGIHDFIFESYGNVELTEIEKDILKTFSFETPEVITNILSLEKLEKTVSEIKPEYEVFNVILGNETLTYVQNFPYNAPPPENAFQLILTYSEKSKDELKIREEAFFYQNNTLKVYLWKNNKENKEIADQIISGII